MTKSYTSAWEATANPVVVSYGNVTFTFTPYMLGTLVAILITAAGVGDLLLHGSLGVVLIQVPCSKCNPDMGDIFFFNWGLLYLSRCTTGHNFLWGCQSALPPEREDFLFIHGIPEGYRAFPITLYP